MIFEATPIDGAFVVRLEPRIDERGFFARTWCRDEFAAHGIAIDMVQASVSHNRTAGTLRGMHYSAPPSHEGKLVRCERGRIFDVIVDLRQDSATFLRQFSFELDDRRRDALYIPPQVAHGFQTLEPDSDVLYMMSDRYAPELARGVRHDDPRLAIRWPLPVSVIAERDRSWPDFAAGIAH
ncbi:MAG: dTDP-4-dehydrorhamnose 3,5-epimerase family protein [Burkholderiaceae bacterium]